MSEVRTIAVDLFTPDEHAIVASWFGAKPPAFAQDIVVDEAIGRLVPRAALRRLAAVDGQLFKSARS